MKRTLDVFFDGYGTRMVIDKKNRRMEIYDNEGQIVFFHLGLNTDKNSEYSTPDEAINDMLDALTEASSIVPEFREEHLALKKVDKIKKGVEDGDQTKQA